MRARGPRASAPASCAWAAMHLDGDLADPELGGDLLVARPAATSFMISRSRSVSAAWRAFSSAMTPASWRRARSRSSAAWIASSISWSWKGLARNSTAPAFMAHAHRDVAVAGDEDDRKGDARLHQVFVEREAALAGQPHVEHEAAGRVGLLGPQEFLR